jgi:hypothetical protein
MLGALTPDYRRNCHREARISAKKVLLGQYFVVKCRLPHRFDNQMSLQCAHD